MSEKRPVDFWDMSMPVGVVFLLAGVTGAALGIKELIPSIFVGCVMGGVGAVFHLVRS